MKCAIRARDGAGSCRPGRDEIAYQSNCMSWLAMIWKEFPLAYHITFGTYGTRLHGDERGTIDRAMNQPGDPIIGADAGWRFLEENRLKFPARVFTREQMIIVESIIPEVCIRGRWELHACAAGPDHIHVVL